MSVPIPSSPNASHKAIRRRQSMNVPDDNNDNDQHQSNNKDNCDYGDDELHFTSQNLSTSNRDYYHRNVDDDDDLDAEITNPRTPMIMDSEVSSPRRDGLVPQNKTLYNQLFIGVCGIAILLTILMLTWVFKYLGGIGFSSPLIVFNFHPLLMMFGFVLIFGKAMLIYRSFRGQVKPKLKLLHAILNGSVIFVCFLGSLSVLYFHHEAKIPHFYSLHSWLGILTWTLFLGQFSGGFIAFMYPGASYSIRSMMMPFHRFAGVATFVLASATCLTGLNEKAIFAFNGQGGNAKYSDLSGAGILTNVIAIVLVAFVSMVVYLVTRPDFKRIPLPEEQQVDDHTAPKHASST